jgi:hypothetical protein
VSEAGDVSPVTDEAFLGGIEAAAVESRSRDSRCCGRHAVVEGFVLPEGVAGSFQDQVGFSRS